MRAIMRLIKLAILAIVILIVAVVVWPATRTVERVSARHVAGIPAAVSSDSPISVKGDAYFDDLRVEDGQVLRGDVVVYDGDVEVEDGGRILGSLVVYSGDVDIQEGGLVRGSVSAFSGDVTIAGSVGGDLAAWSGDVALRDSAEIGGDVSVLSGEIDRDGEAQVGGNVLRGPSLSLPELPPNPFGLQAAPFANRERPDEVRSDAGGWIWGFVTRAVGLGMAALFMGLLAALLAYVQPHVVKKVQDTLENQAAVAFVVGIVTNIAMTLLVVILAITICLAPLAIVPTLLLVGLNFVGWVGLAAVLAGRLSSGSKTPAAVWTGASAMLLTGGLGLILIFGNPCLTVIGGLATFVASSLCVGAAVLPFARKYMGTRANGKVEPVATTTNVPQRYTVLPPQK